MKIYIIGALIGAVIGYITNWLAIKMLFRPREAKYIFGKKLPFTPGLIPKEKSRIANKVGETVGTHLLNSDSLNKALKDKKIKDKFNEIAKTKIEELIYSDEPLNNYLEKNLGVENYYSFKNSIVDRISKTIVDFIREEDFKNKVSFYVLNSIKKVLRKKPEKLSEFINSDKFREIIEGAFNEEKLKVLISRGILKEIKSLKEENLKIEEIIPKELKLYMEEYIKSQKDTLCNIIKNLLRDEEISNKIKSAIGENIPSIVAMFLSSDLIYGKLVTLIDRALEEEENKEYICDAIIAFLNESMKKNTGELLNGIGEEKINIISEVLGERLADKINKKENIDILIEELNCKVSSFDSYDEIIKLLSKDYEEKVSVNIENIISQIVNREEVATEISKAIEKIFDKFLQNSPSQICYNKQKIEDNIVSILDKLYNDFVENKSAKVLEIVDIASIVESQINAFEVDYAEEIIIGIANKELKAITWLGALLGGVLGILSPLLSTMYM